ncbi:AAA family ATPase [Streptomyces sp. NBC_01142]|uniref:AAA family ATPase n=1 Tax=Streptomyces sp. NBC_01142 TaxID=2975865 RepID=UPI002251A742|nr:AAA family ATPase [Streptomyces sp. NBC_01142]MCX4821047.1 AAA family ATPase [Streptomyces sp. NBC_01142]
MDHDFPSPASLAFLRLDRLLARAVEAARTRFGAEAAADSFRGLFVSAVQAERALEVPAGEPLLAGSGGAPLEPDWKRITDEARGWAWLRDAYGLSDLELDVVLLTLAPEMDLRYERLYGYLQDDVSRRRPTVGLALDLLTATPEERLAARGVFGAGAPMLSRRVLTAVPDPRAVAPPLLAHFLVLDEQIIDVLLGQTGLDRRLAPCCRLTPPPPAHSSAEAPDPRLLGPVERAWGHHPLRLYFHGPPGAGRRRAAESLAGALRVPLLSVDAGRLPQEEGPLRDVLALVLREASLQGALLYIDGVCGIGHQRSLADQLAGHEGVVVMSGTAPWAPVPGRPLGVRCVTFLRPDAVARRAVWERTLAAHGAAVPAADLDALAGRFRLGHEQIEDAVLTSLASGEGGGAGPGRGTLFAAARGQTGHDLAALTRRIEPVADWDDLVLPTDSLAQLHELCEWVAHRQQVMEDWGIGRRMSQGKGISALFAGPSGTGKTMATEVVAHELGLDLFKIDLSSVISKYIGETEKNLERVFIAAADANAILLFDEADALFGKRSEVHDAHDRYANVEISYLLQRMEQYDGLAVLATNLRRHMDDAFTRRLQFVIDFPFPEDAERRRIWKVRMPPEAPCDPAIDYDRLAGDFQLSGGNIRNVVLHAAYLAAAQRTRIGMTQLLTAVRREYQKMGKVVPDADPYAHREPA